jgi:hypothetical protein
MQSASGQVAVPPSTTTDTSLVTAKRLTAADTIRAIQRLFKKRRTVGTAFVVAGGTLVVASLSDIDSSSNSAFFTGASAYIIYGTLAAIYTAPLYVPGLILRGRYSKEKEAALIAAYNLKKPIPQKYLSKLKPRLFKQIIAK